MIQIISTSNLFETIQKGSANMRPQNQEMLNKKPKDMANKFSLKTQGCYITKFGLSSYILEHG